MPKTFEDRRPMGRVVPLTSAKVPLEEHAAWLGDDIRAVATTVMEVHEHGPKAQRICTTGVGSLDDLIGGWLPGQTYVIAGKTGGGKTSLATHSALCLALTAEQFDRPPVLFFSLEMTHDDMANRAIAWLTGVPQDQVQRASFARCLTDDQVEAISKAHALVDRRIRVVCTTDASASAIRAAARHAKATHGVSAIVVDHIGLAEPEPGASRGTREREVAYASRACRAMAMELDVPVIVLCQLGRRADKEPEPHLSMLKESGSIENDASGAVLFLWPVPVEPGEPFRVRLIVGKRRFGRPWVETTVEFDGATGRFEDGRDYVPPGGQ